MAKGLEVLEIKEVAHSAEVVDLVVVVSTLVRGGWWSGPRPRSIPRSRGRRWIFHTSRPRSPLRAHRPFGESSTVLEIWSARETLSKIIESSVNFFPTPRTRTRPSRRLIDFLVGQTKAPRPQVVVLVFTGHCGPHPNHKTVVAGVVPGQWKTITAAQFVLVVPSSTTATKTAGPTTTVSSTHDAKCDHTPEDSDEDADYASFSRST